MDFVKTNIASTRLIQEFDLVIIFERFNCMDHIYVVSGSIYNNRYGAFYHDDFIGKEFGEKIFAKKGTGWVYALRPSPELWTLAAHTRTQIVDEVDASIITFNLDIFPGCRVIESGTGSGCMSLSLARAVAPNGHVNTFEYNATRAQSAIDEFKR